MHDVSFFLAHVILFLAVAMVKCTTTMPTMHHSNACVQWQL